MAQKKITDLQLRSSVTADLSLPADDGIQTYRVTPGQFHDFLKAKFEGSEFLSNLGLTTSVGSSALTVAVKTKAGNDATSVDAIRVGFRSATLTSGTFNIREITASLSMVVSSGSTLGQTSGQAARIFVYLIDNGGTVELAVSRAYYPADALVSTTAEGGAGAADSATAIYSTTARSNVPVRCIGYIDNTQTTAGTWASAGTQIQLFNAPRVFKKPTVTKITSGSGTYNTPVGCTRIRLLVVGPGGGGGGGGSTNVAGSNGSASTTFGPLTGGAGVGGGWANAGGSAGGTASVTTSATVLEIFSIPGGGSGGGHGGSSAFINGGIGGSSFLGGAGGSQLAAGTNSGSGGGGGGHGASGAPGCGGSAGGAACAWILSPDATYSYAVGSGGAGGAGNQTTGGAGAAGIIIVEEFYD